MRGSPRLSRTLKVFTVVAAVILVLLAVLLTVVWLSYVRSEDSRILADIHNALWPRPPPRTRHDHIAAPAFRIIPMKPSPENTLLGQSASPTNPPLIYQIEDNTYFELVTAALSPDGKNLALIYCAKRFLHSRCSLAEIEMRSMSNEVQWLIASDQAYCIQWAAFSPDGRTLITKGCKQCLPYEDSCEEPIIQVWSVDKGQRLQQFWGGEDFPRSRAFIMGESVFLSGHAVATVLDGQPIADQSPRDILQCSIDTGKCQSIMPEQRERLLSLFPSPDGEALFAAFCQEDDPSSCLSPMSPNQSSSTKKWAISYSPLGADQPKWTTLLEGDHPGSLTGSASGAYLLTEDLKLYSAQTGAFIRDLEPRYLPEFPSDYERKDCCLFNSKALFFFSANDDDVFSYDCVTSQVWNLATGKHLGVYRDTLPCMLLGGRLLETTWGRRQLFIGRCTRSSGGAVDYCVNGAMWIYSW